MGLVFEVPILIEALCGLLLIFWAFYFSITKNYSYWQDRGVPYIKPTFPFGNTKDFFFGRKHLGEMYNHFYKQFENEPYFGVYDIKRPVFVVRDPELIKSILTKDFNHFQDRLNINKYINPKTDYLTKHLFNIGGQEWKKLRVKISPTFTSGKMKMMFFLMERCGEQLSDYVSHQTELDPEIDIKDILSRFSLDIIATCAFGLETNSLQNESSEFYRYALKIFNQPFSRDVKRILFILFPSIMKFTGIPFVAQELTDFYTKIVKETIEYREVNKIDRNDFLNLLSQVRQNKNIKENGHANRNSSLDQNKILDDKGLTIEEITAQSFVFFAAGFETSSSTTAFCLYELAQHQEIQDKLYQEIKETLAKHGGKPTYQALQQMPYMDKVINETLRCYASLSVLNRMCTEPYQVPGSDLVLEKGVSVIIPTFAIHHDSRFYEEPYKFDPERFTSERIRERHPYVHLPFGEGPRNCIGMRFGLLQTKIGLTHMLVNFQFSLTPKTEIPVQLNKKSFVTQPDKPMLLHLTRR